MSKLLSKRERERWRKMLEANTESGEWRSVPIDQVNQNILAALDTCDALHRALRKQGGRVISHRKQLASWKHHFMNVVGAKDTIVDALWCQKERADALDARRERLRKKLGEVLREMLAMCGRPCKPKKRYMAQLAEKDAEIERVRRFAERARSMAKEWCSIGGEPSDPVEVANAAREVLEFVAFGSDDPAE